MSYLSSSGCSVCVVYVVNSYATGSNFKRIIFEHRLWIKFMSTTLAWAAVHFWWRVNIDSDNGLVPPSNRPLRDTMLVQTYVLICVTGPQSVNSSILTCINYVSVSYNKTTGSAYIASSNLGIMLILCKSLIQILVYGPRWNGPIVRRTW